MFPRLGYRKKMFSLDIPEFERAGRSAIFVRLFSYSVRYVLERKDWTSAITLAPTHAGSLPLGRRT